MRLVAILGELLLIRNLYQVSCLQSTLQSVQQATDHSSAPSNAHPATNPKTLVIMVAISLLLSDD